MTSIEIHPTKAAAGIVRTQAHMMLVAIPPRTALNGSVANASELI